MPDGGSPPLANVAWLSRMYEEHFEYVWRNLRRLGVPEASVDDATQEVFMVVVRRWRSYDGCVPPRAWLFGILRRIASRQRRALARRTRLGATLAREPRDREDLQRLIDHRHGAKLIDRFLDRLSSDKREVFVLAELEQMSAREIGASLGVSPNTAASRLRGARREFDRWFSTLRARERRIREDVADEGSLLLTRARAAHLPGEREKRQTWRAIVAAPGGTTLGLGPAALGSVGFKALIGLVALAGVTLPVVYLRAEDPVARPETPSVIPSTTEEVPARTQMPNPIEPRTAGRMLERRAASEDVADPARAATRAPRAVPDPREDPLTVEAELIERARAAVKRGEPGTALELLARHERDFPTGRLVDERRVTRVLALCATGKTAQARGEAHEVARRHPGSALAQRLLDACPRN